MTKPILQKAGGIPIPGGNNVLVCLGGPAVCGLESTASENAA